MKRKTLSQLLYNNRILKIFAVVVAVLLYIIVAMTNKDTITKTIHNVPVNLEVQDANLANLKLYIIDDGDYYVDIQVSGPRTVVPDLNADSPELATTVRIPNITEPGDHTLVITSALTDTSDLPFAIESYSPRTIQVRLDRIRMASFDIQTVVRGLAVAPGYVQGTESVSNKKVSVTGPETEVNKIAGAEVVLDLTEPLDQTYARELPIILRDAQGEEIDPAEKHLSLDIAATTLVIPVLEQVELPLRVDFLNAPRGFPVEELRSYMRLSADTVLLAGPGEVISRLTEIHLGDIDIKELEPGNVTFVLPLGLEEISTQIQSMENVTNITVTFDDFSWMTARFNISEIRILNAPLDYDVRLLSTWLEGVEFVGTRTVLESMTADDIVAEVNLADYELSPGQRNIPVKISVPGKGMVWAVGDHSTVLQVSSPD